MAVEAVRLGPPAWRSQEAVVDVAELLVLATGGGALAAVDLHTGALVRTPAVRGVAPFDVLAATVAPPDEPDPAMPDALEFTGDAEVVGRLRGRRVERYVRPLLHPQKAPLLGTQAVTVPYWTLDGGRPSLAVVAPEGPMEVVRHGRRVHCFFPWRGHTHDLPVVDPRVSASMAARGQRSVTVRRRFVAALTPPYDGHCYKVVAGILPRT